MNTFHWSEYGAGDHRVRCPACGRRESDRSAGLTIESDGRGVLHCYRCRLVLTEKGAARTRAPRAGKPAMTKLTAISQWGLRLWDACQPISGVAREYLQARRCCVPPEDGDLRWHPSLKHRSGYVGPALVGLITHVQTRKRLSLHRTWITPTGKADVDPPRMPLANHSTEGGCIRLWPDEAVTYGLAISEGIETALSLAWAYNPVWATIDAGHMRKFPVLDGVETLVIGCDQDEAGREAARECGDRWAAANREVLVTRQQKNDLNDVLTEAA